MFTGIIQSVGSIEYIVANGVDKRVTVATAKISTSTIALGDSVAVNGVCLTAVSINDHAFTADVSAETIKLTTFRELTPGSEVNLELALTPHSRLGGHMVSGHVDGIGRVMSIRADGVSKRYEFEMGDALSRYVARKGSICINGVSLTVNEVSDNRFTVNLVPHTLQETTLKSLREGSEVNLEVDLIARYLERLLTGSTNTLGENDRINEHFLHEAGIITT